MRHENWSEVLAEQIEGARKRPFSFGAFDCALWAADVVLAMTGVDYAAKWRERYNGDREALKLIAAAGGLREMAAEVLGEPIAPTFAQRGDVVLITGGALGYSLGICNGVNLAAAGHDGLVFLPMRDAVCAWRV